MTEVVQNYITGTGNNDNEERKLFVGGLSWDTTEEDLSNYFTKYGQISSVHIKYNAATGNPRGFGFVTFASDNCIQKILDCGPHSLKNKVIDPRKAKTRPNCKKIFVGGLDSNMSEEEIRDYFSRYGTVEGVELPFDRSRGRRREFGFVIFDTEEAADAACLESKQSVGGRDCDIKKAQPQNQIHNQRRFQHQQHQQQQHHHPSMVTHHHQHQHQDHHQAFGVGLGWAGNHRTDEYVNIAGAGGPGPMGAPATGSWRDQKQNGFRYQNAGGPQNMARTAGGGGNRGYHRGRIYSATNYGNQNGAHNYGY